MSALSDRDDFENAYLGVFRTLRVLAASPEQACALQGHYNVAYETVFEANGWLYIFNLPACTLTGDIKKALEEIIEALQLVPPDVLAFTNAKDESLEKLKHSSWELPRAKARLLIEELIPTTETNTWYFEQDRSNW